MNSRSRDRFTSRPRSWRVASNDQRIPSAESTRVPSRSNNSAEGRERERRSLAVTTRQTTSRSCLDSPHEPEQCRKARTPAWAAGTVLKMACESRYSLSTTSGHSRFTIEYVTDTLPTFGDGGAPAHCVPRYRDAGDSSGVTDVAGPNSNGITIRGGAVTPGETVVGSPRGFPDWRSTWSGARDGTRRDLGGATRAG